MPGSSKQDLQSGSAAGPIRLQERSYREAQNESTYGLQHEPWRCTIELPLPVPRADHDRVQALDEADWPGGTVQRFRYTKPLVQELLYGYSATFVGMLESEADGVGVWTVADESTRVGPRMHAPLNQLDAAPASSDGKPARKTNDDPHCMTSGAGLPSSSQLAQQLPSEARDGGSRGGGSHGGITVVANVSNATFGPFARLCFGEFRTHPLRPGHTILAVNPGWTEARDIGQLWDRELKRRARQILEDANWEPVYCLRPVRSATGVTGVLFRSFPHPWRLYMTPSGVADEPGEMVLQCGSEPPRKTMAEALNKANQRSKDSSTSRWRLF